MIHLGLETLLIIGQKRRCLWLMLWHVPRWSPKCQEKPATHLVDEAIKMGAKIVSVGGGKTLASCKKGIDKE